MKPPRKRFHPKVYAGIIARQGGICGCGCGEELGADPREIQFDHHFGLEAGGTDTPDNLRAMKRKHHTQETAREAGVRGKTRRIKARDGMKKRRPNQADKALRKILEGQRP